MFMIDNNDRDSSDQAEFINLFAVRGGEWYGRGGERRELIRDRKWKHVSTYRAYNEKIGRKMA